MYFLLIYFSYNIKIWSTPMLSNPRFFRFSSWKNTRNFSRDFSKKANELQVRRQHIECKTARLSSTDRAKCNSANRPSANTCTQLYNSRFVCRLIGRFIFHVCSMCNDDELRSPRTYAPTGDTWRLGSGRLIRTRKKTGAYTSHLSLFGFAKPYPKNLHVRLFVPKIEFLIL